MAVGELPIYVEALPPLYVPPRSGTEVAEGEGGAVDMAMEAEDCIGAYPAVINKAFALSSFSWSSLVKASYARSRLLH